MKLNNKVFVVSQGSTVDRDDNLNSLFKILNGYKLTADAEAVFASTGKTVGKDPLTAPIPHVVSAFWQLDEQLPQETEFDFELSIFRPNGELIGDPLKSNVVVEKSSDKFWLNFVSAAFTFVEEGPYRYHLDVTYKDEVVDSLDYRMNIEFNIPESID